MPGSQDLFDFDDLESPPSAVLERLEALRGECALSGLSVGWCCNEGTLRSLLATASEWGRYGIHALRGECSRLGVRVPEVNPQREDVLWRLRCSLVWGSLSLHELEEECARRCIPYYPTRWWVALDFGPVGVDRKDPDVLEKGMKEDLRRRLMQDSWQGAQGPLPSEGLPGYWRPRWSIEACLGTPAWTALPASPARDQPSPSPARVRLQRQPQRPHSSRPGQWRAADFKDAGPKVWWFYNQFPWFQGAVPGYQAEFAWTDDELEVYFASNGQKQPRRQMPKPPPQPAPQPQQQRRPAPDQQQQQQQQQQQDPPKQKQKGSQQNEELMKKHYASLGICCDATLDEVKRAYRRLALQYHPDKAPDLQDSSKFRLIREAYEKLSLELAAAGN